MENSEKSVYDEDLRQCLKTIKQLIYYLNIQDTLHEDLFREDVDFSDLDQYDDIDNIDSYLGNQVTSSLSYLLTRVFQVPGQESVDSNSYSISIIFHNLIALFLRIMNSKDEELSLLRSKAFESYPGNSTASIPESDMLRAYVQRIHDLQLANQDQTYFYTRLISKCSELLKNQPVNTSIPSRPLYMDETETPLNSTENEELLDLRARLHTTELSIQTEKETNSQLHESLAAKEKEIAELNEKLKTVNVYLKDMNAVKQKNVTMRNSHNEEVKKLRTLLQKCELEIEEKDQTIQEMTTTQNALQEELQELKMRSVKQEQYVEECIEEQPGEECIEEQPGEEFIEEQPGEEYLEEQPAEEFIEEQPMDEYLEQPGENYNDEPLEEFIEEQPVEDYVDDYVDDPTEDLSNTPVEELAEELMEDLGEEKPETPFNRPPVVPSNTLPFPSDAPVETLGSQSAPLPTSEPAEDTAVYREVINRLHRDIFALQREKTELTEKLNAAKDHQPRDVVISSESDNSGQWSVVERLQSTLNTLQKTIHEKNNVIFTQNEQILALLNKQQSTEEIPPAAVDPVDSSELIELREQHEELQSHILDVEEENRSLKALLQKMSSLHTLQDDLSWMRGELDAFSSQHQLELEHLQSHYEFLNSSLVQYRTKMATMRDELQNYKGNYRVMIRVRPINETDTEKQLCLDYADDFKIAIHAETPRAIDKTFVFDRVLPPVTTQEEVFAEVEPLVHSVFRGLNCCILAYGQTGSGKTYSMSGEGSKIGIIPRTCRVLFDELSNRAEMQYGLKLSVCELYNETVKDLLNHGNEVNINSYGGNYLSELPIQSFEEGIRLIQNSTQLRTVGKTKMNVQSSRSHMLVTFYLVKADQSVLAKLTLVDLAGSECLKQTDATDVSLKESKTINLSLFELTNVLRALNTPNQVVCYRNSVLTRMLKDCLGGKSKNVVLIHLNPTIRDATQSLNSLQLGEKIASIQLGDMHARKSIGNQAGQRRVNSV